MIMITTHPSSPRFDIVKVDKDRKFRGFLLDNCLCHPFILRKVVNIDRILFTEIKTSEY